MKSLLVVILYFFTTLCFAQDSLLVYSKRDTTTKKIRYYGYLQTGALIACNTCLGGQQVTFTAAIVQGFAIGKRLRMGAGVGFDSYYGWQVMPYFGSAELDMIKFKNRSAIIFQFQYGGSIARLNDEFKSYGYSQIDAGRMVFPQVGYRMQYHDLKLGLLLGAKYQRLASRYEYPVYRPTFFGSSLIGDYNRVNYENSFSRFAVALQIGWR